jgi:hypothetical protein
MLIPQRGRNISDHFGALEVPKYSEILRSAQDDNDGGREPAI